MNLPNTYVDVPNRESFLGTSEAQALLDSLPSRICESMVNHYLDSSSPIPQEIHNYFIENSRIFAMMHQEPGSALGFEYLYTRQVTTPIDRYFINCKAGLQIYQRLLSLEQNLPYWLNSLLEKKESILVDNIGSGTGRDMIGVISKNTHLTNKVKVRLIDPDTESLSVSKRLVEENGIADSFSFHGNKFSAVLPADADVALLIGILCPLHQRVSMAVLRRVMTYVRGGGIVIYSTALHKMVIEDPFTDFLMRFGGWHMSYKSEEESEDLAKSLGWRVIDKFYDEPLHYHCMVVAEIE